MPDPAGKPPRNLTSHSYTSYSTASTERVGSRRSCMAKSSEESLAKAPSELKICCFAARFSSHVIAESPSVAAPDPRDADDGPAPALPPTPRA